jgi:hypothetical protein
MERGFENDADGFLWLIRMLGHARLIERGMLPANLAQSLSIEKTWLALHHYYFYLRDQCQKGGRSRQSATGSSRSPTISQWSAFHRTADCAVQERIPQKR